MFCLGREAASGEIYHVLYVAMLMLLDVRDGVWVEVEETALGSLQRRVSAPPRASSLRGTEYKLRQLAQPLG